jgi:hypothetical protein
MQPWARHLTPWLRQSRTLFAVLGRYPLPLRGRLGLDFAGEYKRLVVKREGMRPLSRSWHSGDDNIETDHKGVCEAYLTASR